VRELSVAPTIATDAKRNSGSRRCIRHLQACQC
jgi:hypothetical protein